MGLTYVYGCVHTEVHVCRHDRRWVPTPNVRWRMVRVALAHAVWLRGEEFDGAFGDLLLVEVGEGKVERP